MAAVVVPFVRAGSYAVRAKPAPAPTEWIGTCRDDGRETRTWALSQESATNICAAQLGIPAARIDCIRADGRRLSGNGAA